MIESMQGKIVVVTGGARRVGRGLIMGFAAQGASVVIHHSSSDDDAESASQEARALGVEALVVKADLRDRQQIVGMFARIADRFGRVDVLVNSAAIYPDGDLLDLSADSWDEALAINLNAPFFCTQHAGRLMRDRGEGGAILNIADNSGLRPSSRRPQHSVAKAGLIMLTRVSARSLGRYAIRVNCLVLGPIIPEPGRPAAAWAGVIDRLPLKRSGDLDSVAGAAIAVAGNTFMTGSVVHVDGGEWLGNAAGTDSQ